MAAWLQRRTRPRDEHAPYFAYILEASLPPPFIILILWHIFEKISRAIAQLESLTVLLLRSILLSPCSLINYLVF